MSQHNYLFGQNMTEHNPAPSPSGHPLLSDPPTLRDIHQIFTSSKAEERDFTVRWLQLTRLSKLLLTTPEMPRSAKRSRNAAGKSLGDMCAAQKAKGYYPLKRRLRLTGVPCAVVSSTVAVLPILFFSGLVARRDF